jgi:hypothetical protein
LRESVYKGCKRKSFAAGASATILLLCLPSTYQIVIEAAPLRDEKRTRNAGEFDVLLEFILESVLDERQRDLLLQVVLEDRRVRPCEHVRGWQPCQWLVAVEGGGHDFQLEELDLMRR